MILSLQQHRPRPICAIKACECHYIISSICQSLSCLWMIRVCNAGASIPQPPPRMPVQYAEQNESEEEKQFRKVFKQLAGDVSAASVLFAHLVFSAVITLFIRFH